MRWKINCRELCVHSALSAETRRDGGWTQSPVVPVSDHLKTMRSVENCTLLAIAIFPYLRIHTFVVPDDYFC